MNFNLSLKNLLLLNSILLITISITFHWASLTEDFKLNPTSLGNLTDDAFFTLYKTIMMQYSDFSSKRKGKT